MNSLLNEKRSIYSNMERGCHGGNKECANINIKIERRKSKDVRQLMT